MFFERLQFRKPSGLVAERHNPGKRRRLHEANRIGGASNRHCQGRNAVCRRSHRPRNVQNEDHGNTGPHVGSRYGELDRKNIFDRRFEIASGSETVRAAGHDQPDALLLDTLRQHLLNLGRQPVRCHVRKDDDVEALEEQWIDRQAFRRLTHNAKTLSDKMVGQSLLRARLRFD